MALLLYGCVMCVWSRKNNFFFQEIYVQGRFLSELISDCQFFLFVFFKNAGNPLRKLNTFFFNWHN